jgi:hypothetical protein
MQCNLRSLLDIPARYAGDGANLMVLIIFVNEQKSLAYKIA